jgi:ketosteroid isomerase-like protein
VTTDSAPVMTRLRSAFETRDLDALAPLLADDVRWGDDDDHPRTCRNAQQVVSTFARAMDDAEATITEMVEGTNGILCGLDVHWRDGRQVELFQVFLLRDGRVAEIRGYDDRRSAAQAAGL